MGWQKFLMKRGLGSPGHVARHIARRYWQAAVDNPSISQPSIVLHLFKERIAAQSTVGGPPQYKYLKANPRAIDELVEHHPDIFSIVMLCIFIEYPGLLGAGAPPDAFDVLQETVEEVLDSEVPYWRTDGIWSGRTVTCSLCQKVSQPNAARMSAAIENRKLQYLCDECTPPLQMRAMSAHGFFMGDRG
jgi:hypothetical protein